MIKSMTGFGRWKGVFPGGAATIEIKTVNHKFFEMTAKLPNSIATLEDKIRDIVQKKVKRGKVYLNLIYDGVIAKKENITLNDRLAKSYYNALLKLKDKLRLKGEVVVDDLILFPGVLNYEVTEDSILKLWPKIKGILDKSLARLLADRLREGRALHEDLSGRAKRINKMLDIISKRAVLSVDEY